MKTHLLSAALVSALTVAACGGSDDTTGPDDNGTTVHLSAAQATTIRSRIAQLAPVHPELAWLADTIKYVAVAGVDAEKVDITTGLSTGPFYALSLQRTIKTSASGTAAFDVILFNNPSDPTDFIIASGWINPGGSNTTPPTSVSGTFGSPTANSTVNAHLFQVQGSTVSAWRAVAGTASFSLGTSGGACVQSLEVSTSDCSLAELHVAFDVTDARSDNASISSIRTATLPATDVSGIIIRMLIQ